MATHRGGGRPAWSPAILVLMALQGCGLLGSSRQDEVERELVRNRRQWQAAGLDDYRYVGRRICFCPGEVVSPVVVEVRDGQVATLSYQESGEPVEPTYSGLWPTIDGVFELVQEAIDGDAADIRVEYDPDLRFPRDLTIDYMAQAVDEELGYRVEEFESVQVP